MKLDNVFKKTRIAVGRKNYITFTRRPEVPEGLLRKCNKCGGAIIAEDVKKDHYICPKCGGYFRVHARRRIEMVTDEGSFEEWDSDLQGGNPLEYKGYEEKLEKLQEKTGLSEAVITGKAKIDGRETAIGVCDGRFLMASMGEAVGEKIARAVERATEERLPVILFACSGGARMQEGIVSLMQMAKTSAALKHHSDAGLLYISILTDPTTGGVTASFAMLGDVILAEPKALIGFAGPRVIEQTIGQKLPEGFQRAEFLLEHGFLDAIVERPQMKAVLSKILALHENGKGTDFNRKECAQDLMADGKKEEKLTAWQRVELSRRKDRPVGSNYIDALFTDFVEFHGDRYFADDKAIIGGVARFHGMPVTVIAQAKGRNTKENIERNFGMPEPEGYRKALRLMKQAEKFARPVICLVDTPGAFCGLEAEERGQGEAIARNIYEMSGLKVPVVSIIIGEGGSGGALAMATADEVWMLENSIYSILSPEGFASILWKDSSKAKEAAEVMKLTAENLKAQGIVERVFAEPETYTVQNMDSVIMQINEAIEEFLMRYGSMSEQELIRHRYERFRNM
ncbi:acetyl-CoA carboxylase carboxyltransferase subunit alpha [Dorea longicatena]|uniref:acetyl-CoA carboxylase carboxyltransferase subunit alpha n=1 Tax=Dorea longicatena TaxID=88431 RepID=UPI001D0031F3|nr:acetyl-CoA carboxylase carboxyltransferase subunit alpha [Dorea longicatena]MCB5535686.1 acetyl-CoA carboxylase carboxyltransferase subunit alpha [bacterium MSK17_88]MCB5546664.1 acetyl-CoA carboxylase carboxyltransferase subunit alpha [Dorea longicatena]MCG4573998.1 acetyl-CoA carboxylase carboxyltransferase subunit alpha [Dorea longicatena]